MSVDESGLFSATTKRRASKAYDADADEGAIGRTGTLEEIEDIFATEVGFTKSQQLSQELQLVLRRSKLPPCSGSGCDVMRRSRRQVLCRQLISELSEVIFHESAAVQGGSAGSDTFPELEDRERTEPLWFIIDSMVLRRAKQVEAHISGRARGSTAGGEAEAENREQWHKFWTLYRQGPTAPRGGLRNSKRRGSDVLGLDDQEDDEDTDEDDHAIASSMPSEALDDVAGLYSVEVASESASSPRVLRSSARGLVLPPVEDRSKARAFLQVLPTTAIPNHESVKKAGSGFRSFKGYEDYKQKQAVVKASPEVVVPPSAMYRPGLSLSRLPDEDSRGVATAEAAARARELDLLERALLERALEPQRQWGTAVREYLGSKEWRAREVAMEPVLPLPMTPRTHCPAPGPNFRRLWERPEPRGGGGGGGGRGGGGGGRAQRRVARSLRKFADICSSAAPVHPHTDSVRFLNELPPKLDLRGTGFGDGDALALAQALPKGDILEAVDLGENSRLSNEAACRLLEAIAGQHKGSLKSLKLDRCCSLGKPTIEMCTKLLKYSLWNLEVLDLSGMTIGMREYKGLGRAIAYHKKISDVRLVETGLGKIDCRDVVRSIISNRSLRNLDLGWNSFNSEVFEILGRGVVDHKTLRSIGLANTGVCADSHDGRSPILAFMELLAGDKTLTALDLSMNALDKGAALVLESSLREHSQMARINLSRNHIGLVESRSLLRLLAHPGTPELRRILIDESSGCAADVPNTELFDEDPSGRYSLDLSHPVQRALLRLLLARTSERVPGLPFSNFMQNVTLEDVRFSIDGMKRGKRNVWLVPTAGVLSFDLDMSDVLLRPEDVASAGGTSPVPSVVVCRIVCRNRIVLATERKILAVLTHVKSVRDEYMLLDLLEALSRDFVLTPQQMKALTCTIIRPRNSGHQPFVTSLNLLPCLVDPLACRRMVLGSIGLSTDLMRLERSGRWLLALDFNSPSGHYELKLSEPADRAAAERLLLLARWEAQMWKSKGQVDISQWADGKCVRNASYNGRAFRWASPEEWRLPGKGSFSFDYAGLTRPTKDSAVVSDELWERILQQIRKSVLIRRIGESDAVQTPSVRSQDKQGASRASRKSNKSSDEQETSPLEKVSLRLKPDLLDIEQTTSAGWDVLWVLRSVSAHVWLRCDQFRELLCILHDRKLRAEALVSFCLRCVDWPMNGKMCRPKFTEADWLELRSKLGCVVFFHFFQPESVPFHLDLSVPEQKRILHTLIRLGTIENPGGGNFKGAKFDKNPGPTPNLEPFTSGIPLSWEAFDAMPSVGVIELTYRCSQEDVRLRGRRKLAASVGGWNACPDDLSGISSAMLWWSVLDDVSQDAVRVLAFLARHFKDLEAAFAFCDVNKDGKLNHKEFVQNVTSLGFLKKERKIADRSARSSEMPGAGGALKVPDASAVTRRPSISKGLLAIEGLGEDEGESEATRVLTAAYRFLDFSNKGEITWQEFTIIESMWREMDRSVAELRGLFIDCFGSLEQGWSFADTNDDNELSWREFSELAYQHHFDGPLRQIFMYLDLNNDSTINQEEWMLLTKFASEVGVGQGAASPGSPPSSPPAKRLSVPRRPPTR